RVVVVVVCDQLRHDVDHGLRETLGPLRAPDLRRAVLAERLREIVGDLLADDDRVRVGADVFRSLGGLGHRPERVLVELALVVEYVGEDPAHPSNFLSSSQATIFSTVSPVSSSSMISPACFSGGGLISSTVVREPCSPTRSAATSTSPIPFVSSCFFFAPMIALSDG